MAYNSASNPISFVPRWYPTRPIGRIGLPRGWCGLVSKAFVPCAALSPATLVWVVECRLPSTVLFAVLLMDSLWCCVVPCFFLPHHCASHFLVLQPGSVRPSRIPLACPFQGCCLCHLFRFFRILPLHDDNRSLKLLSFFPVSRFYVVSPSPRWVAVRRLWRPMHVLTELQNLDNFQRL